MIDLKSDAEFLGTFEYDCWPDLTAEQKSWRVVDLVSPAVFLGSYDEQGNRLDQLPARDLRVTPPAGADAAAFDAAMAEAVRLFETKGYRASEAPVNGTAHGPASVGGGPG
ncbi:MAG: hypothetical protein U0871_09845 [Gemmataceae bacterium]